MSKTTVTGREIIIERGPMVLFSLFSDMSRFTLGLPDEYKDKVSATADSISVENNGMKFGIVISERVPFSKVIMQNDASTPINFTITLFMNPLGIDKTLFHIELEAELNMMMKMLIGHKLNDMVDTLTDQLEKAFNNPSEIPDLSKFAKNPFS